ncbi:hypothetical protein [Methylobacterium sp. CCH5-D2]|uniref:hypothetical protein n=1 Tax=Methylobacterium sp. CCH5-D2 TaxID=1768765 RepID=UPI00082EDB9C|nr:hypothetical protein [Methylobacterium sp. CCH5-D2]
MNAPLHTYRGTVQTGLQSLLDRLLTDGAVTLTLADSETLLRKAIRVADVRPLPKAPPTPTISDRALVVLVDRLDGRVASSGDLGRAVLPASTTTKNCCARGAGFLNRLGALGDVEKVEGEGWRVTAKGRARATEIRSALQAGEALA